MWRCGLWKHLSCIIRQKGHTQQVIILLEYVVIICNLHCTAVGMFVLPSKKAPTPPLHASETSHYNAPSYLWEMMSPYVAYKHNADAYVGLWVTRHIVLFSFQREKVVKDLRWALKWNLAPNEMLSVKRCENTERSILIACTGPQVSEKIAQCNLEAVAERILRRYARTPDALSIFFTPGNNCL